MVGAGQYMYDLGRTVHAWLGAGQFMYGWRWAFMFMGA